MVDWLLFSFLVATVWFLVIDYGWLGDWAVGCLVVVGSWLLVVWLVVVVVVVGGCWWWLVVVGGCGRDCRCWFVFACFYLLATRLVLAVCLLLFLIVVLVPKLKTYFGIW